MILTPKAVTVLVLWTLIALYFGFSGLCALHLEEQIAKLDEKREELQKITMNLEIDDSPPLTNKYDYEYYMQVSRYDKIFPLVKSIPSFLGLILTAMFFSLLGAIVKIILGIVKNEYSVSNPIRYFSEPVLGFFTGICVLGISYVLPSIFAFNTGTTRPVTLMFFSLFCGIYARNFFDKLAELFSKFFK